MSLKAIALAAFIATAAIPAAAAPIYDFSAANPLTLTGKGITFFITYGAASLGVGGDRATAADASFLVNVEYYNTDGHFLQSEPTWGGKATSDGLTNYGLAYMLPPYEKLSDYYFTFTTTSDQTIQISDITTTAPFGPKPDPVLAPIPAVPEVGTWIMMLTGFGATGATLRSRRTSAKVSAITYG